MPRDNPEQLRLLLVEDSPADVYLVNHAIRGEGLEFAMQVASDGETAIQLIETVDDHAEKAAFNLMVVDMNVPRRSGTEVLGRLRRSTRCGSIPVLMISSSDSFVERQRALDSGANEYFCKPSSLAEFMKLGKMVRALHERRLSAA